MILLRGSLILLLAMQVGSPRMTQSEKPPQAEISNRILRARLYLPDANKGFYRGTRFDWSGVIRSLEYNGHNYYGPWFTKIDPHVIDFIFEGPDIIAGPCSAVTGPVEEFSWHDKALGFDEAKPGGTFIKIGVGVLRRPDEQPYNPFRLYDIVDPGKWSVESKSDSVEFAQEVGNASSGYAYRYTKIVRLVEGKPDMILEHKLENTGSRKIETSVYDHNFLVLDGRPVGPDFVISVPYAIHAEQIKGAELVRISGHELTFRKKLEGRETVWSEFSGFGKTPGDYRITIENGQAGAGMMITGDRPLSRENFWSIRSVLAMEPFIDMSIGPGQAFTWTYHYSYYSLNRASK